MSRKIYLLFFTRFSQPDKRILGFNCVLNNLRALSTNKPLAAIWASNDRHIQNGNPPIFLCV